MVEEGVEVGEGGEVDWRVWVDGVGLALEGAQSEGEGLFEG